jgi:hypothetical protein
MLANVRHLSLPKMFCFSPLLPPPPKKKSATKLGKFQSQAKFSNHHSPPPPPIFCLPICLWFQILNRQYSNCTYFLSTHIFIIINYQVVYIHWFAKEPFGHATQESLTPDVISKWQTNPIITKMIECNYYQLK